MRQLRIGDPWVEAHQMRPEELLAEARVLAAARRAIRCGSPQPRGAGRRWGASALVRIGRQLLVGILGSYAVASLKRDA
jgi:hypothetical protein